MKTTILGLLLLFSAPFLGFAQSEADKELEKELKDVRLEVEKILRDLEDERIVAKVDSVLQLRWPQLEAELEEAWDKAEPRVEEVEEKIEQIAGEILKEAKGEPSEKPNPKKEPRKRQEM